MIYKSSEINKIDKNFTHIILFYVKNQRLKNKALNLLINNKTSLSSSNISFDLTIFLIVFPIEEDTPLTIYPKYPSTD